MVRVEIHIWIRYIFARLYFLKMSENSFPKLDYREVLQYLIKDKLAEPPVAVYVSFQFKVSTVSVRI